MKFRVEFFLSRRKAEQVFGFRGGGKRIVAGGQVVAVVEKAAPGAYRKVGHSSCEGHHGLAEALRSVDWGIANIATVQLSSGFCFRVGVEAFRVERVDDNAPVHGVIQDRVNLILQRAIQKARGSQDEDTLARPVRQEVNCGVQRIQRVERHLANGVPYLVRLHYNDLPLIGCARATVTEIACVGAVALNSLGENRLVSWRALARGRRPRYLSGDRRIRFGGNDISVVGCDAWAAAALDGAPVKLQLLNGADDFRSVGREIHTLQARSGEERDVVVRTYAGAKKIFSGKLHMTHVAKFGVQIVKV